MAESCVSFPRLRVAAFDPITTHVPTPGPPHINFNVLVECITYRFPVTIDLAAFFYLAPQGIPSFASSPSLPRPPLGLDITPKKGTGYTSIPPRRCWDRSRRDYSRIVNITAAHYSNIDYCIPRATLVLGIPWEKRTASSWAGRAMETRGERFKHGLYRVLNQGSSFQGSIDYKVPDVQFHQHRRGAPCD